MTFEEVQCAIEQMLSAQQELQDSQLQLQDSQLQQRGDIQEIQRAIEQMLSAQQELQASQFRQRDDLDRLIRLVDPLVSYSLTSASGRLNLEERMKALEQRVERLESNGA